MPRAERDRRRRGWMLGGGALVVVAVVAALIVWLTAPSRETAAAPDVPVPSATGVAGYLFQDRDGDGERGVGEPLLPGWEVRVHSTGPAPLTTTATDEDGVFSVGTIDDVTPGETTVELRVQPVIEGPAATNLPDPSALTQPFTVKLGETIAIPVASFAPCLSADRCPDLMLPDLVPQLTSTREGYPSPTETRVDTETEPGRVLLRFATSTANLGGMLHVTAAEVTGAEDTQVVQQRVYAPNHVYVHDAGEFVYHSEHHHFHLGQFQSYELVSQDRSTVLGSSEKISFCLTDVLPVDVHERADGDVFLDLPPFDCGVQEQGINSGYADYYGAELPDQWIDVTGVPSGRYWVRLTVDPQGLLLESDTTNNTVYFPVDYVAP